MTASTLRRVLLVACAIPLGVAAAHCGSDAATVVPDGSDGAAGDGSTTGDSAPVDASSDTATKSDADADTLGPVPEGGAPSDPGKVPCGTTSCDVSASFCCNVPDGGASCETSGGACNALGGLRHDCNESSDCPVLDAGAQVCCYEVTDKGGLETSCHLDCNGGGGRRFQACRRVGECLSGACAVRSCNGDAGVASIESCVPIPSVCP